MMFKMLKNEFRCLFVPEFQAFAARALAWRTIGVLLSLTIGLPAIAVIMVHTICEYLIEDAKWFNLLGLPAKLAFAKHTQVYKDAEKYRRARDGG